MARAAGFASLVLLASSLPFELKNPLFHIGPLAITNVEIFVYLVAGSWAAFRVSGQGGGWTRLHTAVALWGAALIMSAVLAPSHRPEAFRFALRSLGGGIVGLAAVDLVRTRRAAAIVGLAVLCGAAVSASAAITEAVVVEARPFLALFKAGLTWSGGLLRAGGTFQYPNIGSMYWEAALPLALTLPLWWAGKRLDRRWIWLAAGCNLILFEAILLAASRAGIFIAILTFLAILFLSPKQPALSRKLAAYGLTAFCLMIALHSIADSRFALRLLNVNVASWYRAEYADFPAELVMKAGGKIKVPLTVRNTGLVAWSSNGREAVMLTSHWLDSSASSILIWNSSRSGLPAKVASGASVRMEPWIIAPRKPGRYSLRWDMLIEGVSDFSVWGGTRAEIKVEVLPSAAAEAAIGPPLAPYPLPMQPTRLELWRAALRLWLHNPLLGVGPDNFRRLYGPQLGISSPDERTYANNLYLETLADNGLIGLLALLAILITSGISLRKLAIADGSAEDLLMLLGVGASVSVFWLHGMVDYFFAFTCGYGQFWLMTGILQGLSEGDRS